MHDRKKTLGQLGALLAIAPLYFAAGLTAVQAQTVSFADAMTVLARDCGADVKKFCRHENLGNNEIGNCLEKNQAKVSQQCTSTLSAVTESIGRRLAAQAEVFKTCAGNARQHCNGVVGEVHILQCLIKTERIDSKACNQAITDAGWR